MKTKIVSLIVFAPLVLLLAYLSMVYVREYIVVPIIHFARIIKIFFEGLPKEICWGIFLLIMGVITIHSLMSYLKSTSSRLRLPCEESHSRAKTWSNWVTASRRGNYSKWLLARHFTELFLNILVFQEEQSIETIKANFLTGGYEIPDEIDAYLQLGLYTQSFQQYSKNIRNQNWFQWLNRFRILNPIGSMVVSTPLDLDPLEIVEFIEKQYLQGGSL